MLYLSSKETTTFSLQEEIIIGSIRLGLSCDLEANDVIRLKEITSYTAGSLEFPRSLKTPEKMGLLAKAINYYVGKLRNYCIAENPLICQTN